MCLGCSDDVPQHQEGLSVLRENTDLVRFIVSVAQQKIQQVCDKGHTDGSEGSNKDKLYKYCCNMARYAQFGLTLVFDSNLFGYFMIKKCALNNPQICSLLLKTPDLLNAPYVSSLLDLHVHVNVILPDEQIPADS